MRAPSLVAVVIALQLGGLGCGREETRRPPAIEEREAAAILESTPWLDRAPEHESDVIHAWVFPRGEGLYFVGNAHKGSYELFRYFVEEDELRIRFLDDGSSHKVRFRIERVDDRVFDYRLTFDRSPRGPAVYYGFAQHRGTELPGPVREAVQALPVP